MLDKISLKDYKSMLTSRKLLKSHQVLLEGIDNIFEILDNFNIKNMFELSDILKTKTRVLKASNKLKIDIDYLTILRREVRSHIAKPRPIDDYLTISKNTINNFISLGIKDSKTGYNFINGNDIKHCLLKLEISKSEYQEIKNLFSVTALRYVSPLFATLLVKSGYTSREIIASSNSKKFLTDINKTNSENKLYKGNLGDYDMQFLIDDAKFYCSHL